MSTAYLVIPSVDCNTQFKHYGTPIELVPQSLKNLSLDREAKIPEMDKRLKKNTEDTGKMYDKRNRE